MAGTEVQKHSVHTLVFRSLKRTHDMFIADQGNLPGNDLTSDEPVLSIKARDEYGLVQQHADSSTYKDAYYTNTANQTHSGERTEKSGFISEDMRPEPAKKSALVKVDDPATQHSAKSNKTLVAIGNQQMLVPKKGLTVPKPKWHPPWKLYRVISGHIGWVRCVAVEPGNEWFVTGAADRVIKIWDLASGTLKLSLTGHVSTVRGVVVSARQPYLFSCGEDKQVKCWDLEQNKVVRHYHGHLSAVHAMDLHPSIDLLVTCGRDATARVWDIRTASCIHTLTGHTSTVADVKCQATDPQVITGSHDNTVRLWDLVAGKSAVTLTHHKKSIRSVLIHPTGNMMASASADNIREWKFPDGDFIQSLSGHNAIINTIAMNEDNVLVSGADNGSLYFWDFKSGYNFQREQTKVQPGSIDSEAGIFASTFDRSGTRFITCEADKTIKIYKEDDTATEDTHPINWRPDIMRKKRY